MGIDRKDVRVVCHFNVPKSMEAFYQESGRAGRDQCPSRSMLYYGLDDRRRMEFILSKASNKKDKVPNSDDSSKKKSLFDFCQMIEYCEQSGCRRKKILECFGEMAPGSLCAKTCDACEFPSKVARHLDLLASTATFHGKNESSSIYMTSASYSKDRKHVSEFWDRDDEASASEEDISDSDDYIEMPQNNSPLLKKMSERKVIERMNVLQRAEEKYYGKQNREEMQGNKGIRSLISGTLRESGKQKLLSTLKQNQHRFSNLQIDFLTLAAKMEDECFNKYEKSGKSFYLSQMASTVRWLSTASSSDLIDRISEISTVAPDSSPTASSSNMIHPQRSSLKRQMNDDGLFSPMEKKPKTRYSVFALR